MITKKSFTAVIAGLVFSSTSFGQNIVINSPSPWMTLRNDSVVVKAQIDTAIIKQRNISITIAQVENGKSKAIQSKKFPITGYSNEFSFGKINTKLIGGTQFLKIDWTLPAKEGNGNVEPIGIVDLNKENLESVKAIHAPDGATSSAVASLVKNEQFRKIGQTEFAAAWNKEALFFVIKKGQQDSEIIKLSLDGKNGKYAFLSYPDRIINYSSAKDSVWGTHFTRSLSGDTLKYTEKPWKSDLSKEKINDVVVVKIPYYDTGIMPFEGRQTGFAAFTYNASGKESGVFPQQGSFFIPGTWTDLVFLK
jgi:hypothetical protein